MKPYTFLFFAALALALLPLRGKADNEASGDNFDRAILRNNLAPEAPPGSFNPQAAERGQILFAAKAQCATCHVPPLSTEASWNLHEPAHAS